MDGLGWGKKGFLGEMTLSRREEIYNKRTGWCNATTCGAHAVTVKKFSVIKMKETCKKTTKDEKGKAQIKGNCVRVLKIQHYSCLFLIVVFFEYFLKLYIN